MNVVAVVADLTVSWYTPWEMAKRVGFYHSAQGIGAMLAGALQAAIYKSLNGKHGLEGWRWNFIINGERVICGRLFAQASSRFASPFAVSSLSQTFHRSPGEFDPPNVCLL